MSSDSDKMWKCEVCGYVHVGPEPPAQCPVCGVGPDQFSSLKISTPEPPESEVAVSEAWRCTVCDYVHEGSEPPERCPVCGAQADLFEPETGGPSTEATETVDRIVIVGAGVAGVTAAEHARKTAPGADITLVSKEPGKPYLRLNLTRYLAGEVGDEELPLQRAGFYEEHAITLRHGEVERVEREARQVVLTGGARLGYDRLVMAQGAHPFVPPITGATREGVLTFRTTADARAILDRVGEGRRCVCIGGGLLGLETAGALERQGLQVTVVEGYGWLLPRQLPKPAGKRLAAYLEDRGIQVRAGASVKEIRGDEAVGGVALDDGTELPAELVVISAGVRPNSWLARTCGLKVQNGVVVDDRMATDDPAIFAAGDLAEHRGVVFGIWPTAFAQGMVAGINAAGGRAEFPGAAPSNRLKVLDVDVFSIGRFEPADASDTVYERQDDERYARLLVHDGKLVGAALYGDTALAGRVKEAIEQGTQLQQSPLAKDLKAFDRVSSTPQ